MLLEARNLKKYFARPKGVFQKSPDFVRAVDDVSFHISTGENLSIVGESGCGKTTLARLIVGLYPCDSGEVMMEGGKIVRKNLQMVFQDPYSSLDPRWPVRNILEEAFTLDKENYQSVSKRVNRMQELLSAVQLPADILERYPHEFSGGERQRIAIARALMLNPKLLILDEATSSLDVLVQEQILKLLKDLQRKFSLTYLFISHNLRVVKKISHRIAVMYQGKIVEIGPAEKVLTRPEHPYTRELLTAAMEYKAVNS